MLFKRLWSTKKTSSTDDYLALKETLIKALPAELGINKVDIYSSKTRSHLNILLHSYNPELGQVKWNAFEWSSYPTLLPFMDSLQSAQFIVIADSVDKSTQKPESPFVKTTANSTTSSHSDYAKEPVKPNHHKKILPNIKHIVAISSNKGGVGKSTTSVGLAKALVKKGYKVGLLDADIYGASIPRLLGYQEEADKIDITKPPIIDSITFMSLGLVVKAIQPIFWKGPIVSSRITQLLEKTHWGELDFLVIDTPPGTGDANIAIFQNYEVDGVVLVSTLQSDATLQTLKTLYFLNHLGVQVIGFLPNMTHIICKKCKDSQPLFYSQEGEQAIQSFNMPLFSAVPYATELQALNQSYEQFANELTLKLGITN